MFKENYMSIITIFIYIIIGIIIYQVICKIIKKLIEKNQNIKIINKKKKETTLNLIRSIIKYVILGIVIISILNILGINTTSIIASLGVAGVVVGLAFQDIVKNLIAGTSIIFDNHYMQGDFVTINGFEGEVIALGLQTTKIKSYKGDVLIINNSSINEVINHSMYPTILVINFPIASNTDLDLLDKIIMNIDKKIIELPEVKNNIVIKGVEELNDHNLIYHVDIDCKPYAHFSVKREFLKELKNELEKNNLTIASEAIDVNIKK